MFIFTEGAWKKSLGHTNAHIHNRHFGCVFAKLIIYRDKQVISRIHLIMCGYEMECVCNINDFRMLSTSLCENETKLSIKYVYVYRNHFREAKQKPKRTTIVPGQCDVSKYRTKQQWLNDLSCYCGLPILFPALFGIWNSIRYGLVSGISILF